ncbi:MAG TPA: hypothetical protein DFR83_17785 [Deltaproteobacteria bacterium]|nr:hypothetical protein [Deltaproteobacteria bacterium]
MKRRCAVGLWSAFSCAPSAPESDATVSSSPVSSVPAPRQKASHGAAKTIDTILVTIETTRADRVGPLYGHRRDTFPRLSERARSGRVYTRAYAASSWTLPSIVSIYTGRSPLEHGVESIDRQLSTEQETIGQLLNDNGVQSAFFGVNPVFVVDRGLADGFDHWQAEVGWHAGRLNQAVFDWVEHKRNPSQPLFLHVHYFDPHCPYIPPRNTSVEPPMLPTGRTVPENRLEEMGGCYRIDQADGTPERNLDVYLDRYDRELRAVDFALERLLQRLAEYGLVGAEDRLVVTADHGEAFWEHDDYGHSHTLWAETVRVPLVIWDRDGPGQVDEPTGLTHLFHGLRAKEHDAPIRPEQGGPIIQSTKAAGVPWVSVITPQQRWISDGTQAWSTHPASDPADLDLTAVSNASEPAPLRKARNAAQAAPPLQPNAEEQELLKALGYSF